MRGYVQCIIRDSARHSARANFYIIEGAQSWTVADQLMKKEIIVQGAAWGHLHDVLIAEELRDGRLVSIAGRHLRGGRVELTAARRRDIPHGPIAHRLWQHIGERAATFTVAGHE
jgi:DNA-binding transcriptional LysR family regulator